MTTFVMIFDRFDRSGTCVCGRETGIGTMREPGSVIPDRERNIDIVWIYGILRPTFTKNQ